jgi:hypothetical protein
MSARYGYKQDDFVVADSDVEYVTAKSKSARASRKQQSGNGNGRLKGAGTSDARRNKTLSRTGNKKVRNSPDTSHSVRSSKVAKKTKVDKRTKVSPRKKALLEELNDLAPYNAPGREDFPGGGEEVSALPLRKTPPVSKPKAKTGSKDHHTAKISSIFTQSKPRKTTRAKPIGQFEELVELVIDQKGYREWQNPFLAGSGEYGYHRSKSAALPQEIKGTCFTSLPGEIRNRIYEALLEDEKHITIKQQSTAEGVRRSARRGTDKGRFNSYSLAQTCRQLRLEYLPLLREHRDVYVGLMELYDYLDVFHPAIDNLQPDTRAAGHVIPVWHDFAIPEGFDVLPLAKIAGASPKLEFVLEADGSEVRLPNYHELEIMDEIVNTYGDWHHLIDQTRLRSIRIFSVEDKDSWYKYDRHIELRCQLGRLPGAKEQEKLLGSWIFKSGMYKRGDLHIEYKRWWNLMVWGPDRVNGAYVVDFAEQQDGYETGYIMEPDSGSEFGYRLLSKRDDDDEDEEED